nr:VOC family protein [Sphingomonas sp. Y57]
MIPFNIFQTAYVAADIDAAVGLAARRFGVAKMQVNHAVAVETGQGTALCHFALAFVGSVQIELIAPAGGADEVYRAMLPQGGGLRLHHIGCLIESDTEWEAVLADAEASGVAMPVRGDFGGLMRYVYLDHCADIGHFVEYMQPGPAGLGLFEAVPRF